MVSMINRKRPLQCAFALSATALASLALAQQSTVTAGNKLEEIVVTAQRFESSLQRTPVAVTALNATALQDRGVKNILDLSALAPNVSIGTRSGGGTASGAVTIRGIGVDANPPASPAVGIYVDDVYLPASWGNLIGIFDVARVEVLRGPQGTLFGRNTISGAIQYVGIKPRLGETSGFAEVTAGSLQRRDVSAGVNIPLGEVAALRVSGASTDRDGYVEDKLNGIKRGDEQVKQARVQLRLEPSNKLTLDFKGEYLKQETNGRASTTAGFNYGAILGAPFAPGGLNPFISTGFYENAGFNNPDFFEATFKVVQGVVSYDISDNISFKSITAYSESEAELAADQDNTPLSIINVSRGIITDKLFSQEFQLTGNTFSNQLHWTTGLYYYDSENTTVKSFASIFGGPPVDPFGDYKIKTKSFSAYGQASYDLTQNLALVGGLRFTQEKVSAQDPGLPGLPLNASTTFTNTSPLIGLNYQLSEDTMLYAKASKGFRAGGYAPTIAQLFYFEPEKATSYEAGARMEFLNQRLRVNPTVFRTDWKNIQFNQVTVVPAALFLGPLPIINNAGDARLTGAELEVQASITERLTVSASAAVLDGEYTAIAPVLTGRLTKSSDLKRAPKTSYTLGGRYVLPLADTSRMSFSLNYAWQDKQRSATTDIDFVPIEAYGLLSGRIEYKAPGDRWSVALFGTNLLDEEYLVGGTNYGRGGTIPTVVQDVGRPRELGVSFRFNF